MQKKVVFFYVYCKTCICHNLMSLNNLLLVLFLANIDKCQRLSTCSGSLILRLLNYDVCLNKLLISAY